MFDPTPTINLKMLLALLLLASSSTPATATTSSSPCLQAAAAPAPLVSERFVTRIAVFLRCCPLPLRSQPPHTSTKPHILQRQKEGQERKEGQARQGPSQPLFPSNSHSSARRFTSAAGKSLITARRAPVNLTPVKPFFPCSFKPAPCVFSNPVKELRPLLQTCIGSVSHAHKCADTRHTHPGRHILAHTSNTPHLFIS